MSNPIPLSVPILKGNELKYVKECIDTEWVSSAGKYVEIFEQKVTNYTGAIFGIACVNATSALQICLKMSGVEADDEVIVPTLTFIAPVNAIKYNNAHPLFMDVDNYYNLDTQKTIDFIKNETFYKNGYTYNKTTKKKISAIIPVHVWGNAVYLDDLLILCQKMNINVVEDASESLGTFYKNGKYKNSHTGTIGKFGCISFNGNKIITTGGGGIILTDSEAFANKARYLTTQAKDDPVLYIHDDIGYNFRLTNIQAALGVAQLEQLQGFIKRKQKNYFYYKKAINDINGLTIAERPPYARNNHWMNLLQIDSEIYGEDRISIMRKLEKKGIQSRPVWNLNHLQKPYQDCQKYKIELADELLNQSLCLPSSSNLKSRDIDKIINCLNE